MKAKNITAHSGKIVFGGNLADAHGHFKAFAMQNISEVCDNSIWNNNHQKKDCPYNNIW